ncbi:DUF4397 domain-containing protein [Pedobacter sp. Hv1]|uniref:DUF4397 domain-containing protein n=1 Tax=Pedobacter sp. Hv1 TaxID=1740090 RepID=UPI0013792D8D|nr:DUF4397 domain-containing protein [Pedobacter sp. Hv1]
MKRKQSLVQISKTLGLLVLTALLLVACKKDKDGGTTPSAKVNLMISSPGATELSLFLNGTKSTTSALNYNSVVKNLSVTPGTVEFSFKKKDVTEVLDKISANVKSSGTYTLIFADKSPKTAVILVEDDLTSPTAEKAKIRFANLSPDAPALDLYVVGKTDAVVTNKTFKQVSAFVNIDPGALGFEIKENGKTEVLATLTKFTIEKGKIYTIWARGLKDPAAADAVKLGIEAMTN